MMIKKNCFFVMLMVLSVNNVIHSQSWMSILGTWIGAYVVVGGILYVKNQKLDAELNHMLRKGDIARMAAEKSDKQLTEELTKKGDELQEKDQNKPYLKFGEPRGTLRF